MDRRPQNREAPGSLTMNAGERASNILPIRYTPPAKNTNDGSFFSFGFSETLPIAPEEV